MPLDPANAFDAVEERIRYNARHAFEYNRYERFDSFLVMPVIR